MDIKYLKNVALYILSAILSLLFIGYIIYHMTGSGREEISTVNIPDIAASEAVTLDAYLLRDEEILYAADEGLAYYLFPDGESVRAGDTVANIYTGSEGDMSGIMEIENRLALLQSSDISENAGNSTAGIDSKIRMLYYGMLDEVDQGNLAYAEQNMDSLLVQLNQRKIIVKTVSSFRAAIAECERERISLMSKFSASATETVSSPRTGNFYSGADGYENLFTQRAAEEMTYDDFYAMISSGADSLLLNGPKGSAVGKISTSAYWSICFEFDNRNLRSVREGDTYPVVFSYNGGVTVNMRLDRILTKFGEDHSVLILGTRTTPPDFNFLRTQSVQLILGSYEGYKVPTSAARYVDGQTGVYITHENQVFFKKIEILYEVDGYYVVRADMGDGYLSLYDEVIVQGKNLYNGKYIE